MLRPHLSQAAFDGLRVEEHFPATALAVFDSGWAPLYGMPPGTCAHGYGPRFRLVPSEQAFDVREPVC